MHDNRTHPLLEQVPLTVSPFVNLPAATTLPYTYKAMPSTLPASVSGITASSDSSAAAGLEQGADPTATAPSATKPKYVVSASGHAVHPDDIMASCRALQAHMDKMQAEAEADLRALDERIRASELAEKRRLAPGWLDSDARILEPERVGDDGAHVSGATDTLRNGSTNQVPFDVHGRGGASEMAVPDEGEQLDRAFGGLGLGTK